MREVVVRPETALEVPQRRSLFRLSFRGRGARLNADPAPSRLAYRLERLWMRRGVRVLFRVGVPVALVCGAVGAIFAEVEQRQAVLDWVAETRRTIETRPEFMVQLAAIDGAAPDVAQEARKSMDLSLPASSFDLDLPDLRARVEALDAVAQASLRIKPGGILQVDITERQPSILWRTEDGLWLLDNEGHRIAMTPARGDWPDLPVITGDGAEAHVLEALSLVSASQPIRARLRGLVRVGERRWDLVLDRSQRILLPAEAPVTSLERLIALSEARELLDRDITHVDLRDPTRPTVRLAPQAMTELRRIRDLAPVSANQ